MNRLPHILVVDDNPTNLDLLVRLLRGRGYAITEAAGGVQGLELLRQKSFDLVLLDVVMPDLGGVELCKFIKADPAMADAFVALISSEETSPENKAVGLDVGADEYIARPIPARELIARINALVRIQQARKDLRIARAELELRVAERTEQLTRANEELRQEIVQRERVANELRERERQLADAQELAHFGSWDWDVVHDKVTRSDEIFRIFGMARGDVDPGLRGFLDRIHPDDRETARQIIEGAISKRKSYMAEFRVLRADGQVRVLLDRGAVICGRDGQVVRMLGVAQDVTERKQAEAILRELPRRILEAQESERRRVARELHDGVNQILSSVRFRIQAIESRMLDGDSELLTDTLKAKVLLERALREVRRISENLRPSELDDLGLPAAVSAACAEFRERTGLSLKLSCLRVPKEVPAELRLALYRIVQEALNNIEKHASATQVVVRLARDRASLTLTITDDGQGFNPANESNRPKGKNGFGLVNLRERATFAGGVCEVTSAPSKGTTVTVRVPLAATGKAKANVRS